MIKNDKRNVFYNFKKYILFTFKKIVPWDLHFKDDYSYNILTCSKWKKNKERFAKVIYDTPMICDGLLYPSGCLITLVDPMLPIQLIYVKKISSHKTLYFLPTQRLQIQFIYVKESSLHKALYFCRGNLSKLSIFCIDITTKCVYILSLEFE